MIRLVTRGRFTHDFVKALIGAPEDREPVVRKLIQDAGGKVISYYITTGETDFLLISEANEAEAVIASLMAASAAGTFLMLALREPGPLRNSKEWPRELVKQAARIDLQASTDCRYSRLT